MKRAGRENAFARLTAAQWLAGVCCALPAVPLSSYADVDLSIAIGIPPPVAVIEAPAPPRAGYFYAPGYWAWHGDRHIWIGGRWILDRPGYYWVAERWEPDRGRWRFVPGHWKRHKHKRGRDRD